MKSKNILLVFLFLLLFSKGVLSQEFSKTTLFDELENIFCTEHNRSVIDNFLVTLQNNPNSEGYIIGYADSAIPGRFLKYYKTFQWHIGYRNFPVERIKFLRGENRDKMTFQFWIVPKGEKPPQPSVEYTSSKIVNKTLFDKSFIREIEKNEVFFGGEDEPCDWGLKLEDFANSLENDSDLTGYLVTYSDKEKSQRFVDNASKLTAKLITSKYNIVQNRLKMIYGGVREEREMELWLVPKDEVFLGEEDNSRNQDNQAVLINEFENNCSEIIALHYDNFLVELSNDPSSAGFIVFNGEEAQDGTNLRYIRHLSFNYPRFRGFDQNRITLIRGENLSKMRIQFWKVPSGADIPKVEKTFEAEKILSTQRFQKTYANLMKISGSEKEELVDGFYASEGCEFAPNLEDFAKVLSENDELTGYLIIYADKKNEKKLKKFVIKNLSENYKIPQNRLKIISGGKNDEPIIELWFVPKNGVPPKIENNPKK